MSAHLTIEGATPISAWFNGLRPPRQFWTAAAKYEVWVLVDHTAIRVVDQEDRPAALERAKTPGVTLYVSVLSTLCRVDIPLEGVTL